MYDKIEMFLVNIGYALAFARFTINTDKDEIKDLIGEEKYYSLLQSFNDIEKIAKTFGNNESFTRGDNALQLGGYIATFTLFIEDIITNIEESNTAHTLRFIATLMEFPIVGEFNHTPIK